MNKTNTTTTTATAIPSFQKVIQPFNTSLGKTWVQIKWDASEGKLSFMGVEGARANGNARGSCGQIEIDFTEISKVSKGYNLLLIHKLRKVWKRWHLNTNRAGSPNQQAYLETVNLQKDSTKLFSWLDSATSALEKAGLNPDSSFIYNGKPYLFGTAWIKEEVPAEVIQWLYSLPSPVLKPSDKGIVQTWFNRATV